MDTSPRGSLDKKQEQEYIEDVDATNASDVYGFGSMNEDQLEQRRVSLLSKLDRRLLPTITTIYLLNFM